MQNKFKVILFFWFFVGFGYKSFLYFVNGNSQQIPVQSDSKHIKRGVGSLAPSLPTPNFDAHVHLRYGGTIEENAAQLNRYMNEKSLEGMFVLSEAYHGALPTHDPAGLAGDHAAVTRIPKNAFTGQVLSLVSGQAIGLCGYNPMWPDGVEVIADCVQHEKMQGLKLRSSRGNYSLQEPELKERLKQVLQAHAPKVRYVLAHMADSYSVLPIGATQAEVESALQRDKVEVETFIQLALEFPQVQFIFGHSLYSDELVSHAAHYRDSLKSAENPMTNLWIEISTSLSASLALSPDWRSNRTAESSYDVQFQQRLVNSWREFGMNRILFGSDILLGGESSKIEQQTFDEIDREQNMLQSVMGPTPGLTAQEFEQILQVNWRGLFEQ